MTKEPSLKRKARELGINIDKMKADQIKAAVMSHFIVALGSDDKYWSAPVFLQQRTAKHAERKESSHAKRKRERAEKAAEMIEEEEDSGDVEQKPPKRNRKKILSPAVRFPFAIKCIVVLLTMY